MNKKLGLLIVVIFVLSVVFSIASQASFVQNSVSQKAVDSPDPSPTLVFYDPLNTSKVLITVNCGEGGSVTPNGESVIDRGTDITFVFTPDEGKEVDKVTIAYGDEEATEIPLISYEHTEVTVDNSLTLNVTFKEISNALSGLKTLYTLDETIDFSVLGARMDATDDLKDYDTRWKPIGYTVSQGTDNVFFGNTYQANLPASSLGIGLHTLRVIFARQNYFNGEGWFYQRPVGYYMQQLSTSNHRMKLAAIFEESLDNPFNEDDYVVDSLSYDFEVIAASTVAPTIEPTIIPTDAPTALPTIEPTTEPIVVTPTPKPEDEAKPDKKPKAPKADKPKDGSPNQPKTGDNTTMAPWIILFLAAGLGAVIFSRKSVFKNR